LDYDAINCFLRTGFYLRGRTPYKQIRREWTRPPFIATSRLSRRQAINEYIAVFRSAIGRMAQQNSVIGLSGGADSRHILLELIAQGQPPDLALTIDLPASEDAPIARALAARLRVRHEVLPATDTPDDEVRKCALVDFRSMQHRWFMAVADRIDLPAWWDGIGGDVLSAGLFLEPWSLSLMREGQFEALAQRLVAPGDVYWFGPAGSFSRDQAIHDIAEELSLHAEAANPIGSFYFWNRTCVDIAASPFGILASRGVHILAPYLDSTVWKFLMSLPAEVLLDHRFHVDAIHAAYPYMADLPFARKRAQPSRIQRARGRSVLPLLWRHFVHMPGLRTLKAIGHAVRAAILGVGNPSLLVEAVCYADSVITTADQIAGTAADHALAGRPAH